MRAGLAGRRESGTIAIAGLCATAAGLGVLTAIRPALGVGVGGVAAVTALAFLYPVAHLTLLLLLTAVVPYAVMNAYDLGGGAAGLLASDVLLLTGLARAAIVLPWRRLDRLQLVAIALGLLLLALLGLQFLHGLNANRDISSIGAELRVLLGLGATVVIALPIVMDEAARGRLFRGIVAVGLVLGLWGLAQWILQLPFELTGDFGVREGVDFTSSGRGQLQGGLYGFPVAVVVSFAVLLSGRVASTGARVALIAVLVLNAVCAVLTFERTFWLATLLGMGVLVVRAGGMQRLRALILGPVAAVLVLVALAAVSPNTLTTARERFLSLGQYGNDPSLSYRLRESRFVLQEIAERPVVGSGLAATIYWGRPAEGVPPEPREYSHNGYLWLAWKLGIPAAVLLVVALALAAVRPRVPDGDPVVAATVAGSQAALLTLLAVSVTFPAFNALSITSVMGFLVAMALLPPAASAAQKPWRSQTRPFEVAPRPGL